MVPEIQNVGDIPGDVSHDQRRRIHPRTSHASLEAPSPRHHHDHPTEMRVCPVAAEMFIHSSRSVAGWRVEMTSLGGIDVLPNQSVTSPNALCEVGNANSDRLWPTGSSGVVVNRGNSL
jgi:hypothetical protein